MSSHNHLYWCCPYYTSDSKTMVRCEGGSRISFPDARSARAYNHKYCACTDGWQKCTIAKIRQAYYERNENMEDIGIYKKKIEDQAKEIKQLKEERAELDAGTREMSMALDAILAHAVEAFGKDGILDIPIDSINAKLGKVDVKCTRTVEGFYRITAALREEKADE